MKSSTPKLIVISAPSGGGKTTLCQRLLRDFPTLTLSISTTTRAPRGQEKHGKDYYFLNSDDFKKRIEEGHFAEWAKVHDHYYGTAKETIQSSWTSDRPVLLDIDVQGADSLKKTYANQCVTIFIAPPDLHALEKRLRKRGTDSEDTIQKRLKNAEGELKHASHFDHVILNDDLEKAYDALNHLIRSVLSPSSPAGGNDPRG